MYVIIADQVNSRGTADRAAAMITTLHERLASNLRLPVDQTSGDELQLITEHAGTALDAVLMLTRDNAWSVGIGIGAVREPLPDEVRTATGDAFYAARAAVDAAKRADGRFALQAAPHTAGIGASDVEPLVRLLILLRARRTKPGWEAADLMTTSPSQNAIATRLGITDAAVSQRLKAGAWAADIEARPALVRLLAELHESCLR